jgi:hypothetical protein
MTRAEKSATMSRYTFCLILGMFFCPYGAPIAETHPCLLIGPNDIPALAAKLGTTHLNGDNFSAALEKCIRGQRADTAVTWLMAWVAHVEATGIFSDTGTFRWNPDYAQVCDLQWTSMTSDEQTRAKKVLIDMSKAIYNESLKGGAWYFADEHINNWAICHMTDYYLQRMLYPALMFPSDSQSAASQARAIDILRHWFDKCPGAISGGAGLMIDETITSPNGYGLWDLDNFSPILIALARNTTFNPYTYAGNLFHNEGIYRTYVLSYWQQDSDNHTFFSNAGYVGAGHGEGHAIVYYNNANLLQLAAAYNDSILAWHYYANPSPCKRGSFNDFINNWNAASPPIGWQDWRLFHYWGTVKPVSPASAGWPLVKFFDGAGAVVMRKSWNKHDGLIWFRAGYGGSHYQPCQGTVIYHCNDTVVLGNGGSQDYSPSSRMNNVLLVDTAGQVSPYTSIPDQRRSYGTMTKIDDNTFCARLDSAYAKLSARVSWTRRVHYDYSRDILEINDSATTGDGKDHLLSFSWVTNPSILSDSKIQLPGGYFMIARSSSAFTCQKVLAQPSTAEQAFNTLVVSTQGRGLNINWFIGKNETDLESYIKAGGNAGVKNGGHPAEFSLNLPHPRARGQTTLLRYRTSGESRVQLLIIDVFGRETKMLVDGTMPAGEHVAAWNHTNSHGRRVGAGIYFCQLSDGHGLARTDKILLVK